MTNNAQDNSLYPEGLYKWAGHSDGGLRLPFYDGLGSPAGKQFVTPLLAKIDR